MDGVAAAAIAKRRLVMLPILLAGLALGLVPTMSAAALIEKYLGLGVFGVYLISSVAGLCVLLVLMMCLNRYLESIITARRVLWLLVLLVVAIAVVFVVVYPIQDARERFGRGLDNDDALDLAATELIHGRYPYYPETYFGNPLSPLPGSVILATPFVALFGKSAVQNLVWIAVLFWIMSRYYPVQLVPIMAITVLSFPVFLQQLIGGSDYIANSIQMLLVVVFVDRFYHKAKPVKVAVFALLSGLILSSRLIYAPLFPLLMLVTLRREGVRSAATFAGLASAAFLAVTLPFYLFDSQGFSPLHTYDKLAGFDSLVPHYGIVIPAVMIIAAVAAGVSSPIELLSKRLILICAAILTIPVLAGFIADSLSLGTLSFEYWEFGMLSLVFWTVGAYSEVVSLIAGGRAVNQVTGDELVVRG